MDIKDLIHQAEELLDLTDDGWVRDIYFDVSKLAEECGEVAAALNKSDQTDEDLADELADVIAVATIIAVKKSIDLEKAIVSKQVKRVDKLLKRFHDKKRTDPEKRISL
jgi:NTP pyrophosphatase (non-canonical NTP hydrolase)